MKILCLSDFQQQKSTIYFAPSDWKNANDRLSEHLLHADNVMICSKTARKWGFYDLQDDT